MKLFGLTGGIGTGKSTVSEMLVRRGIRLIDTDVVAREVVQPGESALAELTRLFGEEIIDSEGQLRRAALAEIVFGDPLRREQLEAVLHPLIRTRWNAQVEQWRAQRVEAAVVVIPLLFETNAQGQFDSILCTACRAATQHERLLARGWTPDQVAARLAAQWPLEKKMAASTHVIWTDGSLEVTDAQVTVLFENFAVMSQRARINHAP